MSTPEPSDPFAGIAPDLRAALERRGFSSLPPVQRAVIDGDTRARDLRISSETGSGKTVALGLLLARNFDDTDADGVDGIDDDREPTRPRGPRALILAPTRELASQIRDELGWLLGTAVTPCVEMHKI